MNNPTDQADQNREQSNVKAIPQIVKLAPVCLTGMLAALLGNVVAGYFNPWFEEQPALALGLFALVSILYTWLDKGLQKALDLRPAEDTTALSTPVSKQHSWVEERLGQRGTAARKAAEQKLLVAMLALLGFALLTVWLAPSVGARFVRWQYSCPKYKDCIIVARFTTDSDAPESNSLVNEINQFLKQELSTALGAARANNLTVVTVPPVTNIVSAKDFASEHGALLIVWGQVLKQGEVTRVHFHLSDRLGINESSTVRPYRIQPLFYEPFKEQVQCQSCIELTGPITRRANMIVYIAAGLAQYVKGQPEQARNNFLAALHCAGKLNDNRVLAGLTLVCPPDEQPVNINLELLYYYTGRTLAMEGNYQNALLLLNKAANPLAISTPLTATLAVDTKTEEPNLQDPAAWVGIGSLYQNWLLDPASPHAIDALQTARERLAALPSVNFTPDIQVAVLSAAGLIAELEGKPVEAMQLYEDALARSLQNNLSPYVSYINLARAQRLAKDLSNAEANLRKAIEYDEDQPNPDSPWAALELARTLSEYDQPDEKRTVEVKRLLKRAVEVAAQEPYVYTTQAELCPKWADSTCAQDLYKKALTYRPDSGWLHGRVGDFYRLLQAEPSSQAWAEAKSHYRRAVELRPCDPWSHTRLAYVLASGPQPDYPEAIRQYQLARQLVHPDTNPIELANLQNNLQILQATHKTSDPSPTISVLCQPLVLQ